ncbi:MAG: hypothetical protein IPI77_19450 [Saprospiraceae bacterium]|nr:hypothetical protein [Saprospiraceae bacterium]
MKEEYDIFFFFPFYCIGGAERVNAEIIRAFPDKKLIVFFTKKSQNNGMKHFFVLPNVEVKEIQTWTDNKFIYWANFIFRGICSQYINSQRRKPAVFIGQCNFGYKLTPHLRRDIKISDLLHTYHSTFLWIWAPFIQFIDERVLISPRIKSAFTESFIKYGIPLKYIDNIKIVSYCLEYIPEIKFPKSFDLPLKVYYAGRGGNQKRVWIIISIINKCRLLNLPLEFKLAGSFQMRFLILLFLMELSWEKLMGESMYQFHKANDILLTSAREGFPIVIMEAMAFGSIPLIARC